MVLQLHGVPEVPSRFVDNVAEALRETTPLGICLGMFDSPSLYSWRSRSYPFPKSFAAAHFCKVDLLEGRVPWQEITF